MNTDQAFITRRKFFALTAAAGAVVSLGPANAQGRVPLHLQFDWLMDNAKIGDIVALNKGYLADEGLDVTFSPGGPNAQTVASLLSDRASAGQMGSNQILAAYSEGMPLTMFATTYQETPLVFVSLPKSPIRTPQELIGKKVAVTPNGRWLVNLMLKVNKLDESQVTLVSLGTDLSPLLLGQVDAAVGFATNTKALAMLGNERVMMKAKDAGIPYYTGTYFATHEVMEKRTDDLAKFIRAVAKGWGWAFENRKEAVDIMCDAYPALDRQTEYETIDTVMAHAFGADTKAKGWGWMDADKVDAEIRLFEQGGGFKTRVPDPAGVFSAKILEQTADARPKLG